MTDEPTLADAITRIKRAYRPNDPWKADDFTEDQSPPEPGEMEHDLARILNAVVAGDLTPADDKDATIARLTAENAMLTAENAMLTTADICEVAVRNPRVMEYMKHWEGRAEQAEAKLDEAGTFAQGIEAAKKAVGNVDVYEPCVAYAIYDVLHSIRALSPTPQADPVREARPHIIALLDEMKGHNLTRSRAYAAASAFARALADERKEGV